MKNAVLHFDDLATDCVISVKDDYGQKYAVLVDLVQRVKDGECTTEEADGLLNQIEILDWMLKMGSAD